MNNNILNDNDFKKRSVDDVKISKSKEYLWKVIQKKTGLAAAGATAKTQPVKAAPKAKKSFNFFNMFMPKRIAWAGVVAVLVIIGILVGPNIQNLLQSGQLTTGVQTVSASFEMSADTVDSSGVAENSSFTLTSTQDYPADVIAQNLKATPEVAIDVTRVDAGKYTVTPQNDLTSNKIYKFSIISQTETGPEEFSWAYQVKNTFRITGTLPGDKTSGVPINSGIEINFSSENFDLKNAANYFEITPAVKGKFEQHLKTLVFVPGESLKPETIYTVTLKKDFPLLNNDQKITQDKLWKFETAGKDSGTDQKTYINFTQDYYEVSPRQDLALEFYYWNGSFEQQLPEKVDVQVFKYASIDEYTKALNEELNLPSWAYYLKSNYLHDTSKLEDLGTFEAKPEEIKYQKYIYFPNSTFKEGYYLFQIKNGNQTDQALIQITDLASFITMTKTKSLIWIADLAANKPSQNAKIEISPINGNYTTNNDGAVVFDTPVMNTSDEEDTQKNYIFKIQAADGKSLISTIQASPSNSIGSNYWMSLTTDRPMYKPDDTVKFWGFMKAKNAGASTNNLKIRISEGYFFKEFGEGDFLLEQNIKLSSDNTFEGEIKLDKVPPAYYNFEIYSGDQLISSKSIQVQNYVKPAYNISAVTDKQAVFAGEKYNVDVKSNFFDGTPVPYMELQYYDQDLQSQKKLTTDANGELNTDFTTKYTPCEPTNEYCSNIDYAYLNITPTLAEQTNISANTSVRVFNSKLDISADGKTDNGMAKIDIQTHFIDLTKLNSDDKASYDDYLGKIAPNRVIKGKVMATKWIKTETGEHYDFISKQIVKDYTYTQQEIPMPDFTVTTDSAGKATYEMPVEADKYYQVRLYSPDDDGRNSYSSVSLNGLSSPEHKYYSMKILNTDEKAGLAYFDIGNKVETAFAENDKPLSKDEKGYFMFIQMNDGFQNYAVQNSPYYSFNFGNEDVPSTYTMGLWINDNKIQSAYEVNAYYKKDLKKINIEVTTDKESYKPGDNVTLYVVTKDRDGNPINADVNLNLVDEAYYKLVYDSLENPLDDLYMENGDGILTAMLTHRDEKAVMAAEGIGGCFKEGTLILMADGSEKPIEKIIKGDMVMTKKAPYSAELVPAKVKNTISHKVGDYLLINDSLAVTTEHVIFVNNKWLVAKNLKVGDYLLNKDGQEVKVNSIRTIKEPVNVYNFEVEGQHTYIAGGFYVHNDKGGDGVRSDFEDVALFKTIKTGGDGKGQITFKLPDNITSWRATAKAINGDKLMGGSGIGSVKVTLPVFADIVMNEEYSVKDQPIIKFRAFGNNIKKDDAVEFYFAAKTLGVEKSDAIKGTAYNGSYFEIPALKLGNHDLVVEVNAGQYKDALQKTISVVGSRLKKSTVKTIPTVTKASDLAIPSNVVAKVFFMDAGKASYAGDLIGLLYEEGERIDQRASVLIAKEILTKQFNLDVGETRELDITQYQKDDGGLAVLPYGESELKLTALITYVDPDLSKYYPANLKKYFYSFYKNTDANLNDVVLSLFGLANMNEPVLSSLNLIKDEEKLTLEEKLYIALAFEKLGSKQDAKAMYDKVKGDFKNGTAYETALGAMLAAGLNQKDDAVKMWQYVTENGIKDEILNLYMLGYIENSLKFANPNPASFTVKTSGGEQTKELKQWDVFAIIVTDPSSLEVTNIKGELAAVVEYENEIAPDQFKKDSRITISRTYSVNGKDTTTFEEGDLVKVTLHIKADKSLKDYGFHITDIMPSGLRLISSPNPIIFFSRGETFGYYGGGDTDITYPYEADKQTVHFYWSQDNGGETISYYTKVVTPGKYYADPAKIEAFGKLDIANISSSSTVEINKDTGTKKAGIEDLKTSETTTPEMPAIKTRTTDLVVPPPATNAVNPVVEEPSSTTVTTDAVKIVQ